MINQKYPLRIGIVFDKILEEYWKANNKFPSFHSMHEGFAVLKEEVDVV